MRQLLTVALIGIVVLPSATFAQHSMPAGMTHEQHLAQLETDAALSDRGRLAMGFDQERTTHHFILRRDGGLIRVEVNDPADDVNRTAIRTHLRRIAEDFAAGRFDAPFATHGEEPTGVAVMRARSSSIRYTVEDTAGGAAVRIISTDPAALAAIKDFLTYQIREHRTGDPLSVAP
jgi:hypothetical protein